MSIERARTLRKNATEMERRLWRSLRMLKHSALHFRRQVPIGNYIADFACHRAKLVIELDGGHHGEPAQMKHDADRTKFLESVGYRVLRFWNMDAFKNEDAIAEYIESVAKQPPPDPASLRCAGSTSPQGGGR